jgi:F0F1-type ATP synthase delta subunit
VFHEAAGNAPKLKAYLNARTKGLNHTQAMINTFKQNYSANLKNFIKSYIKNITNTQIKEIINASNSNLRRVKAYIFARVKEGYKNHEIAKQRMKLFTPHLFNMMNKTKFFPKNTTYTLP